VQGGTSLHLRILDQAGINTFYGNTVRLFNSSGALVAAQIINPQSGIGTNDSTAIVNFYGLSASEAYSVELVRIVNGVSSNVNASTNRSWGNLYAGSATEATLLSAETETAVNNGNFVGTGYNDTFFDSNGNDRFNGGGGWSRVFSSGGAPAWNASLGQDTVDYFQSASAIIANLAAGTVTGHGTDTLVNIEGLRGTALADTVTDGFGDTILEGRGGNDTFNLLNGGHDTLIYKNLTSDATGGNGVDLINGFAIGNTGNVANADVLDLTALLAHYTGTANVYFDITTSRYLLDAASSRLANYLNVVQSGANTLVRVDLTGTSNFTTLITLSGVTTDLATLLVNHQLLVATSNPASIGVISLTASEAPEGLATPFNDSRVTGTMGDDLLDGNGLDNSFEGRGGQDVIHLAPGGHDTLIHALISATNGTGGNGSDIVDNFIIGSPQTTANADRIVISGLLNGYVADSDGAAHIINDVPVMDPGETIGDYFRTIFDGINTTLNIDRDGRDNVFASEPLLVITNVHTNLEELLAYNQLSIL
jgi:hypothetical protein